MLLLLFLLLARSVRNTTIVLGLWLCFYGVAGNQLAVSFNGGRMPVFIENISGSDRTALRSSPRHKEGGADTRLKFLSDVFHLERWGQVISLGDILLTMAIMVPGIGYVMRCYTHGGVFLKNNSTISYPIAFLAMITGIVVMLVQYYGLMV